jgi:ankyrin repeat protein
MVNKIILNVLAYCSLLQAGPSASKNAVSKKISSSSSTSSEMLYDPKATAKMWDALLIKYRSHPTDKSIEIKVTNDERIDRLKSALKDNANPNAKYSSEYPSPLAVALEAGSPRALATILVQKGANPIQQLTLPHYTYIITSESLLYPIHIAAREHNLELLEALLAIRPSEQVNRPESGYHDNTPLHMSLENYFLYHDGIQLIATINMLLNFGADHLIKNKKGETPLDMAIKRKKEVEERLKFASNELSINLNNELDGTIKILKSHPQQIEERMRLVPELAAFPTGLTPLIAAYLTPARTDQTDH